jgi:hypothetical protein
MAPSTRQALAGSIGTATNTPDACPDAYAIWANGQTGSLVIDKSGSNNRVNGRVWSNNDINISGSSNVITGVPEYVTAFNDTGSSNVYPPPAQVSVDKTPPVTFDIANYRPGGASADAAGGGSTAGMTAGQNLGNYHVRGGSPFVLGPADAALGGLFYVTGDVTVSDQNIGPLGITLVAEGTIDISGSNTGFADYIDEVVLLSGKTDKTSGFVIKIAGSDSGYVGVIQALGGKIELSGSTSGFKSRITGQRVTLNGSHLTITFNSTFCQATATPTATPSVTPSPTNTRISARPAGSDL